MLSTFTSSRRVWLYWVLIGLCILSFAVWNWRIAKELRKVTDLLTTPRYKHELCILTRVKDVSYLLPQWIEYHTNVGVDHIYIADNGKTMFWAQFYAKHHLVTLYESQDFNNCTQHVPKESVLFDFLFQKAQHTCEWVTVIDADEYMVPTNSQQLSATFIDSSATTTAADPVRLPLKQSSTRSPNNPNQSHVCPGTL